jgi:NADH-quinone oxidoreductase subunit N
MQYIMPLWPAYSELFLLGMVCVILIADLFVSDDNRIVTYALTQLTLLGCFLITLSTLAGPPVHTFSGMFVADALAGVLKLTVYIGMAMTLAYSRAYLAARGMFRGEFFALSLFATLGMMVMISASNLLTVFLGLELMNLSLYSLVALLRDSRPATEAAMKYFVLSAIASGMLLYGMSMLYGATGTLDIAQIATHIVHGGSGGGEAALVLGLIFVIAGLGFEIGAVPFHMWIPDVYHGAPTSITLLLSSPVKFASFAFFMRLLVQCLQGMVVDWQLILIILSVLSLAVGNIVAIAQTNIKRMLAYSTISHMGFVLLGILAGDSNGYGAAMFYVVVYVLMNLGAFGMVLLLSRSGFEADQIDDFKGLNQRSPWLAFMMLLVMFAMAGVPPTVGCYAKLSVLEAVLNAGYVWLAVVAVIFALIGAFYYLRIVKLMYFDAPQDDAPIIVHPDAQVLISANGLAMLLLGILPQPLLVVCTYAIQYSL